MKNPNGFGGITKMTGNRRKPWRVRVTNGWVIENNQSKQTYKNLGYYATRKEALNALAEYNSGKEPTKIPSKITLGQVYTAWFESHTEDVSASTIRSYGNGWNVLVPLSGTDISTITLSDLEQTMIASGKTEPILRLTKVVLNFVYKYSYAHGYVTSDQLNMIPYLDVKKLAQSKTTERPHTIFTDSEIRILWEHQENLVCKIVLVLIYTGLRVNELLQCPKENWHDEYIDITKSKTSAGVRQVPIADKIKGIYSDLKGIDLPSYPTIAANLKYLPLNQRHTCHDTRHTTATLLTSALVDDRVIKMILGHSAQDITFDIYTHNSFDLMKQAINSI